MAPKILVAYASTHGQTEKIASRIGLVLEQQRMNVTLHNLKRGSPPPLSQFDGVVVGASIMARGHQPAAADFIRRNVNTLNAMPGAFFSVSASAGSSREKGREAARRVRDAFLDETVYHPTVTECIAGAIKYTRYNFLLRWYMKRASAMNGGSTDTYRDDEYTDWVQVDRAAADFAAMFAAVVERPCAEATTHSVSAKADRTGSRSMFATR